MIKIIKKLLIQLLVIQISNCKPSEPEFDGQRMNEFLYICIEIDNIGVNMVRTTVDEVTFYNLDKFVRIVDNAIDLTTNTSNIYIKSYLIQKDNVIQSVNFPLFTYLSNKLYFTQNLDQIILIDKGNFRNILMDTTCALSCNRCLYQISMEEDDGSTSIQNQINQLDSIPNSHTVLSSSCVEELDIVNLPDQLNNNLLVQFTWVGDDLYDWKCQSQGWRFKKFYDIGMQGFFSETIANMDQEQNKDWKKQFLEWITGKQV